MTAHLKVLEKDEAQDEIIDKEDSEDEDTVVVNVDLLLHGDRVLVAAPSEEETTTASGLIIQSNQTFFQRSDYVQETVLYAGDGFRSASTGEHMPCLYHVGDEILFQPCRAQRFQYEDTKMLLIDGKDIVANIVEVGDPPQDEDIED